MKKLSKQLALVLFLAFVFINVVNAQSPNGVIYQAEARNSKGETISNETLEVKVSILEDSSDGFVVWEANHKVVTNNYGLFVLVIGTGEKVSGYAFDEIQWEDHSHFLNVKIKDNFSGKWVIQELLSFFPSPMLCTLKQQVSWYPQH